MSSTMRGVGFSLPDPTIMPSCRMPLVSVKFMKARRQTHADEEEQLALVVVLELRERVDARPERLLALGIARDLADDKLVVCKGCQMSARVQKAPGNTRTVLGLARAAELKRGEELEHEDRNDTACGPISRSLIQK